MTNIKKLTIHRAQELKNKISPLDVVLFQSPDFSHWKNKWLMRKREREIRRDDFNHIAVVVTDDMLGEKILGDGVGLLYSTAFPNNYGYYGVFIEKIESFVARFPNIKKIAICTLVKKKVLSHTDISKLRCVYHVIRQLKYDGWWSFIRSSLLNNDGVKYYYCAQLVGWIYQSIGLIDKNCDISGLIPSHFLGYQGPYTINVIPRDLFTITLIQYYSNVY